MVRINCKDGRVVSWVHIGSFIKKHTSFEVVWTEGRQGVYYVKRYKGINEVTNDELMKKKAKLEGGKSEFMIEYDTYMINEQGFIY